MIISLWGNIWRGLPQEGLERQKPWPGEGETDGGPGQGRFREESHTRRCYWRGRASGRSQAREVKGGMGKGRPGPGEGEGDACAGSLGDCGSLTKLSCYTIMKVIKCIHTPLNLIHCNEKNIKVATH